MENATARGRERKRAATRLLAALALPFLMAAQVGAGPPSAERLKAAFVYKFTLLVTWPEEAFQTPDTPLTLCVLGDDPFDGELERALSGRESQGRALTVKRLDRPGAQSSCHVLYVADGDTSLLQRTLAAVERTPTLTIGESEEFADLGGVIRLDLVGGRIRFDINHAAARRAGLEISSKLLQVARAVHD